MVACPCPLGELSYFVDVFLDKFPLSYVLELSFFVEVSFANIKLSLHKRTHFSQSKSLFQFDLSFKF